MKKIKILLMLTLLVLSLCLSGCDIISSFLPESDLGDGTDILPGGDDSEGEDSTDGGGSNNENSNNDNNGNNSGSTEHKCDFVKVSYTESTCSSAGKDSYECSCGKTKEEKRDLLPHKEEIIPATEATENSPAKTEGKVCSVCGYVLVQPVVMFPSDYSTPAKYDGTYALDYLQTLENAENLTKLYNSIDARADLFHISGENVGDDLVIGEINFSEFGLTQDEAIATWSAYVTDHPLYYWMSKHISYTASALSIKVDEEYKLGETRNSYNAKIYAKAEEIISRVKSDSEYVIAMVLHDLIISSGDYAYEADGTTPKDDNYAHNILGILEIGEGVCESYAKSFQMLLNYCGVENVFVSGYAGENHAWNLVKMDDEKWYWFDLTWDDNPKFMQGISYRYFCVSDTEELMGMDGPWVSEELEAFTVSHLPSAKCDTGIGFMYELPESSKTEFVSSDVLLRTTFKVGDFTYAISSYDTVQLVKIEKDGEIVIPASVEYAGRSFDVVSIGCIDDSGLFKTGSLVSEYYDNYGNLSMQITSVTIPATVSLIWDDAFNIHSLEQIVVDKDNNTYASLDGVLFTKDYKTLVKYPSARSGELYIVPDVTENIAAFAFNMYFSNVELPTLKTIRLGSNIKDAGITHYGYGYVNTENGNYREGEWEKIEFYLKDDGKIYAKSGQEFVPAA